MKLIIQNGRIAATATDAYQANGSEDAVLAAPADFDLARIGEYVIAGGVVTLPPVDVQREVVAATQARLDAFASTRNYDGILSAATYATSSIPRFASEGQYAVSARDATWAKLYEMLEEVRAGTRPMPAGFSDIEGDLPPLAWPA